MNIVTHIVRLSSALAEVRVTVDATGLPAGADVRGKLHGPICPDRETVQIAYPLRHLHAADRLTLRAMIPEPNMWTAAEPFYYLGTIDVWSNGARVDATSFELKLRAPAVAEGTGHVG